jgi:hypothetical protein
VPGPAGIDEVQSFLARVLVRCGFSQNEASVADFDAKDRFFKDSEDVVSVFKRGFRKQSACVNADII